MASRFGATLVEEDSQATSRFGATPVDGEQENLGAFPFLNQKIAQTLGFPGDVVATALNIIPGVDLPGGTEGFEELFKLGGIKLPEKGRGPEAISEFAGQGLGEVASFLIPAGAATKALTRAPGLIGNVSKAVWQTMIKHPYLSLTSEATSGLGGGIGRGIGEEVAPDSPTIKTGIEIGGAVVGGIVPSLPQFGQLASPLLLLRQGKRLLRKLTLPTSKKGSEFRAGEFLKRQVADPDRVVRELGEQTIADLPPAVAVGEKRLNALYKGLSGQDPVADAETIETMSQAIIKLEGEMRKLGYGSPEVLADITQRRIASLELNMDKRVVESMEAAKRKLEKIPVAERRAAESRIVKDELNKVRAVEKAKVDKLWKEVPKEAKVGIEATRLRFKELSDELAFSQKGDIPAIVKNDPIVKDEKLFSTTVKEMQGLRSKLLEASRLARKNGKFNRARISDEMADAILNDLTTAASQSTQTGFLPDRGALAVEPLQTALAATRKFKDRFESGIVGKLFGHDKTGAPAISPDLALDISLGRKAQKGALDIDKLIVTPEGNAAAERYITRSFTDFTLDKNTGAIRPIKAHEWLRNNEGVLDNFPGLRNQITDATQAQDLALRTQATMNARKVALTNPKVSASAEFLNLADTGKAMNSIFASKNSVSMARELAKQAGKDTTGDALAGLQAGSVDHILDVSAKGSFNEAGEKTLSGNAMRGFINDNIKALKEIMTPEQISRMKKIASELSKVETFEKSGPGKTDIEFQDFVSNGLMLFSRLSGVRVGRFLSGGKDIQTPAIFSERFKNFGSHLTQDRAFQLVNDAITSDNPDLLKSLLLPLDKPTVIGQDLKFPKFSSKNLGVSRENLKAGKETLKVLKAKLGFEDENLRFLDQQINLWLAGTGSRVLDDINEEIIEDTPVPEIKINQEQVQENNLTQ
jgi:hypothetical protein